MNLELFLNHQIYFLQMNIDKPESLLIVLTILVCPDVFKKFLSMKYGNGAAK